MAPRLELQAFLKTLVPNVYFQVPEGFKMIYPCIVYERSQIKTDHADNLPYNQVKGYSLTVIDRTPDSPISEEVSKLPLCSFDRSFTADNLNHDVFTLFF
jgi:hypothetical protein